MDFKLYLITDRLRGRGAIMESVEQALQGGIRAVQLREKDLPVRDLLDLARALRRLTHTFGAKLFINDRLDAALSVGADGVHLGRKGIPASVVRRVAGSSFLIGVSTHSMAEAEEAEREGADFITFGPIYDTPSKREFGSPLGMEPLVQVVRRVRLPVFAIGGIGPSQVREVLLSGVSGVAVISAIFAAPSIIHAAERMSAELRNAAAGQVDPPIVQ
ncbi:MAG: thiamine phosphate synthase [Nitrospirae bacterium]|nr:thiamine phosphate synthase [Nitrospirota bacterium]